MRNRLLVGLLMLTTFAWSACNSSETPAKDTPPPSTSPAVASSKPDAPRVEGPCGLVTQAQAETVLRAPIERARPEGPSRLQMTTKSACFYRNQNGSVHVTLNRYDTPAIAGEQYKKMRHRYSGTDVLDVAGVGQSAFWMRKLLTVLHGDAHLTLEVDLGDERELKSYDDKQGIEALIAIQKELARDALNRVPTSSGS